MGSRPFVPASALQGAVRCTPSTSSSSSLRGSLPTISGNSGDSRSAVTVSLSFKTFILEQLGRSIAGIRARNMFGGVGIYGGEFFFALTDDDTLYFKVDESTRPEFEARGMGPFQPYGEDGETMGY